VRLATRVASWRPPWPTPAVLAWALGWAAYLVAGRAGLAATSAALTATAAGALAALPIDGRWRRLLASAGFPLSAAALASAVSWPAWVWLIAALPLALAYPLRAWRDAPFFPTPARSLDGLDRVVALPADALVLDAGCGLGHGLRALAAVWPTARLEGVEWSRPLAWLATRRCPLACVRRGDMWQRSWAGFDLVYLFQRPESMARAGDKARREMRAGALLVSLEFAVPGWTPQARFQAAGRRPVWVYRIAAGGCEAADSNGRAGRR